MAVAAGPGCRSRQGCTGRLRVGHATAVAGQGHPGHSVGRHHIVRTAAAAGTAVAQARLTAALVMAGSDHSTNGSGSGSAHAAEEVAAAAAASEGPVVGTSGRRADRHC